MVAVTSSSQMQYFDVEAKAWKLLTTLKPAPVMNTAYPYAVSFGCKMYVGDGSRVQCYDIEKNVWEFPICHSGGIISNLCRLKDYMYPILPSVSKIPERYNVAECQWQRFAKVNIEEDSSNSFYNSGGTEMHSNLYVLYGHKMKLQSSWKMQNAVLHCFDPLRNRWEQKASTCLPHFGSSLFVVSGKMYVVGGYFSIEQGKLCGKPAPVEVYDEDNNTWSVINQSRIPPNKLGAVELEGRVYFIINKFPIDSGIRIPPGELYPVYLDDWKNLGKVSEKAALCYMPLKSESLNVDYGSI